MWCDVKNLRGKKGAQPQILPANKEARDFQHSRRESHKVYTQQAGMQKLQSVSCSGNYASIRQQI